MNKGLEIDDKSLVLCEFLERANIPTENMKASYDEEKCTLAFTLNHDNVSRSVTATLDEEGNQVLIRSADVLKFDIHTVGDDPMTNYETYRVRSEQVLVEFKVEDNKLNVYRASVCQESKGDTFVGGTYSVKDFYSFDEARRANKDQMAPFSFLDFKQDSYSIPEDYKITDGFGNVGELQSSKILRK